MLVQNIITHIQNVYSFVEKKIERQIEKEKEKEIIIEFRDDVPFCIHTCVSNGVFYIFSDFESIIEKTNKLTESQKKKMTRYVIDSLNLSLRQEKMFLKEENKCIGPFYQVL